MQSGNHHSIFKKYIYILSSIIISIHYNNYQTQANFLETPSLKIKVYRLFKK